MARSVRCRDCSTESLEFVRCSNRNCVEPLNCTETYSFCARRCNLCTIQDQKKLLLERGHNGFGQSEDLESHYSRTFQSKTIEIVLKTSENVSPVSYHLHVEKLKKSSDYFFSLFQFAGKEVTENKITLSDSFDDHQAFKYFVEFLYCGDYFIPKSYEPYSCLLHAMVYVLADRLLSPRLKSLAMSKLIDQLNSSSNGGPEEKVVIRMIATVYNGTYSDSTDPTTVALKDSGEEEKDANSALTSADGNSATDAISSSCKVEEAILDTISDFDFEIRPIDPLRTLVSRYAASKLDRLRIQPRFRSLMKEFPEFAEDVMSEASNGKFVG